MYRGIERRWRSLPFARERRLTVRIVNQDSPVGPMLVVEEATPFPASAFDPSIPAPSPAYDIEPGGCSFGGAGADASWGGDSSSSSDSGSSSSGD